MSELSTRYVTYEGKPEAVDRYLSALRGWQATQAFNLELANRRSLMSRGFGLVGVSVPKSDPAPDPGKYGITSVQEVTKPSLLLGYDRGDIYRRTLEQTVVVYPIMRL